jgi:hypothetical protein
MTLYERTLDFWHTLCDDGTRAVTCHNTGLDRWEITMMDSFRRACTQQVTPRMAQVEVRCTEGA